MICIQTPLYRPGCCGAGYMAPWIVTDVGQLVYNFLEKLFNLGIPQIELFLYTFNQDVRRR